MHEVDYCHLIVPHELMPMFDIVIIVNICLMHFHACRRPPHMKCIKHDAFLIHEVMAVDVLLHASFGRSRGQLGVQKGQRVSRGQGSCSDCADEGGWSPDGAGCKA